MPFVRPWPEPRTPPMTELAPEQKAAFVEVLGMVHRHAMRIAELPKEDREKHSEIAKQSLQEAATVFELPPEETAKFADLLMLMMRACVEKIDAGSAGGTSGTG